MAILRCTLYVSLHGRQHDLQMGKKFLYDAAKVSSTKTLAALNVQDATQLTADEEVPLLAIILNLVV